MANFKNINDCFEDIKKICYQNYPKIENNIDLDTLLNASDNRKINIENLLDILNKYSHTINCDDYINNFQSVIQRGLLFETEKRNYTPNSNEKITCANYDICFFNIEKIWSEIQRYLKEDITDITDFENSDYVMNNLLKKKFNKNNKIKDLYDPNIEVQLIQYYIKLFKNIRQETILIITYIEEILILIFQNITNCDTPNTNNNNNSVNIIKESKICFSNAEYENQYLNLLSLLQTILKTLNEIFTTKYYDFYKILIFPLFQNIFQQINYLHFKKFTFVFNAADVKIYSEILLFFKTQIEIYTNRNILLAEIKTKRKDGGKSRIKRKRLNRKNTKTKNVKNKIK